MIIERVSLWLLVLLVAGLLAKPFAMHAVNRTPGRLIWAIVAFGWAVVTLGFAAAVLR